MGEAARLAEASGAAIIDINMGCPAKRVTGGYAGSALMRDLDLATRIIAAVVATTTVPVTVKMRLGWDRGTLNAPELARRAEALGVSAVTVHGRTREQFYKGAADWGAIAATARTVTIPVVANGDVGSGVDARRCLAASGAAGVMIGRAAIGRPWLVGEIGAALEHRPWREPTPAAKLQAIEEHYGGLLSLLGRASGVRHARKHLAAYADAAIAAGGRMSAAERAQLVTTEDPAVAVRLLRALFASPVREAA
jgi:nifR3 family TIM-barrel protein